ncbi:MAG: DUF2459 domain-containing protein [Rhodospirillaceae bacterium]|nr:DUF2459 domain-containing protein [Rhodospirillaceae bacterium]
MLTAFRLVVPLIRGFAMRPGKTITIARLLAFCAAISVAACQPSWVALPASETAPVQPAGVDESEIVIYVMSNGWHSEIVVARAELPAGAVPEAADFPGAPYLSFGWGDAVYYPAPDKDLGMTLSAALLPTPAVVHLAGLPGHPSDIFSGNELIELKISAEGFRALTAYLDASFARDGAARAQAVTPGLHSFSAFYPATGSFHLFNTCNSWTAKGLEQSGLPVRVFGTWSAEDLMAQLRQAVEGRLDGDIIIRHAERMTGKPATAFEA